MNTKDALVKMVMMELASVRDKRELKVRPK
jgi:hypothetical protein